MVKARQAIAAAGRYVGRVARLTGAVLIVLLCMSTAVMAQVAVSSSSGGGSSSSSSSGGSATPSSSGGSSGGGTTGTLYFEEGDLVRSGATIQPLGPNLMGDQIDEYTGTLSFDQTDVSLPGNNALPVAVGRNLVTGSKQAALLGGLFGDWDLDIPHLQTLVGYVSVNNILQPGTWYGMTAQGVYTTNRCSLFARPPLAAGSQNGNNVAFDPYMWWAGYHMSVPGAGDQTLLLRAAGNANRPNSGSYQVVTKDQWELSCLPSLEYGSGEGFLALAPDGTTYRFDHLVSRSYFTFHPAGNDTQPTIPRAEVWILPTVITDRFGNWVKYAYNESSASTAWQVTSITSSDGRTISFTYWPGTNEVYTVSDGTRTWTYYYSTGLSSVKLPDNSQWTFNLTPLEHQSNYATDPGCDGSFNFIDANTYVGTLTHPSGATGSFSHKATWHGLSNVPGTVGGCEVVGAGANELPTYNYNYALIAKTLSGPGMSTMTWSYSYNVGIKTPLGTQAFGSFAPWNNCGPTCTNIITTTTQVTDPEGNVVQNTYGTRYAIDDGLLVASSVLPAGTSTPLRSTTFGYNSPTAGPYPSLVGYDNAIGDEMATIYAPRNSRTITQQNATFSQTVVNNAFDNFARPISMTKASSLNASDWKTETPTYYDDLTNWILGQVASVTIVDSASNSFTPSSTTFTSQSATPASVPYQASTYGKLVSTYAFNADGTLYTVTDGRSNTTTYSNYKRGLAQNILFADSSTQSAIVNNIGTIASVTRQSAFATQSAPATYYTWTYDYDAMGRIHHAYPPTGDPVAYNAITYSFVQVPNAEFGIAANHWDQTITRGNAVTVNYFDARWRKLLTTTYDSQNVSGTQRMMLYEYDEYNRTTYSSYPARSISSINTSPPPLGTCAEQSGQPAGTYVCYDALGRPSQTLSDSELGTLYTTTEYQNLFEKKFTGPHLAGTNGNVTLISGYQAFDEPTESAPTAISNAYGLAEQVNVSISRDVLGKPLSITRSGGAISATRSYYYDGHQRLCKSIDPEIGATIQTMDAADNVQWKAIGLNLLDTQCDTTSVPVNKQIVYSYDARNRVAGIGFGDGSPSIGRSYWPDGLLGAVVSNGSTWTYNYNNYRLPVTEQVVYAGLTGVATHTYDANAHETQLQYPDNAVVTYVPDALGEPTRVGGYTQAGTTVTYQPNGAVAGFTFGNGVVHSLSQNTRLLPSTNQDVRQGTLILKDQYSYDADSNILGITDQVSNATTRTMTYDGLDRLTGVTANNEWGNASYHYDPLDNMMTYTVGGRTVNYTYTPGSPTQLSNIAIVSGGTTTNFQIVPDSQGNVIQIGNQHYTFDQGNRLSAVNGFDSYTYDGLGRRTSTSSNGTTQLYFYSLAGQLLYSRQQTGSNVTTTDYFYLAGHEIAESNSATGIRYVHTDALGSPVAHTSTSGALLDQTRYEPYGATWSGTVPTGIGFTGHVNDSDSGFVYMQQRYYSPIAARFLSMDPVGVEPNVGALFPRYEYALSNPYRYTDPDGRRHQHGGLFLWQQGQFTLDGDWNSSQVPNYNPSVSIGSLPGGAAGADTAQSQTSGGRNAGTVQNGSEDQLDPIVVTANKLLFDPGYGIVNLGLPIFLGTPSAVLGSGRWNPAAFSALAAKHSLVVYTNYLKVTPSAGVEDNSDFEIVMVAVDGSNLVQGVSLFSGSTGQDLGSDAAAVGSNFSDYLVSKGWATPSGPTFVQ